MNTFSALVKREVLDGKNGYIRVPVILTGITLILMVLSSLGLGSFMTFDGMKQEGINNLADVLNTLANKEPGDMSAGITGIYWLATGLVWVAFPFVIFFSLLGALYEERRDRSILFWKSMPVSDWQEVVAKFFTPVIMTPLFFLGVVIAAQIFIATFLSMLMVVQGGPVLGLWPLSLMVSSWLTFVVHYTLWLLWALPVLAWLLFVSSYASRMPFLWAVLAPIVLIVVEAMFFRSNMIANWFGLHLGGWQGEAYGALEGHIDGPDQAMQMLLGQAALEGLRYTLGSVQFWIGLVISGGLVFGAIKMRQRAL